MMKISIPVITHFIFLHLLMWSCEKPPPTSPVENGQDFGTITGRVLNSSDRQPVQNAIVHARYNDITDTTNADGLFRLDSLLFGLDTLILSAPNYDSASMVISVTKEKEDISLNLDPLPHYYIYAGDRGHRYVFVIDTYTASVVDTFFIPYGYNIDGSDCVNITLNGEILIVNAWPDIYTDETGSFYFDVKSGSIIKTFHEIKTYVMPNGYLFLKGGLGRIRILDPDTYSQIMSDTLSIIGPIVFDTESNLLYSKNPEYNLICYNYESKAIIKEYTNLSDVHDMVLSLDGTKLYGTLYPYKFFAFDLVSGEFIKLADANHLGEVAITPDGSKVLLTDPGTMLGGDPGSGKVQIFNTSTLDFENYIQIISDNGHPLSTQPVIIDDTGRYAYAANAFYIHFLDIEKNRLIRSVRLNPRSGTMIWYLALSPNLNN